MVMAIPNLFDSQIEHPYLNRNYHWAFNELLLALADLALDIVGLASRTGETPALRPC